MDQSIDSSYCGIGMTQVWQDLLLWEKFLNTHVATHIVELGTAYGGFSLYLLHQAQTRLYTFTTFDNIDHSIDPIHTLFGQPIRRPPTAHYMLGKCFQKVDVLGNPDPVYKAISSGPCPILFCDNGSKKTEVKLFSPALPERSYLVVHDWRREIGPEDIPNNFTELYGDYCDSINSWTRIFQKC